MLAQKTLLQLQKYNFDLLSRQKPSGRRRLRYIVLAHIKDGKSSTETAQALHNSWKRMTSPRPRFRRPCFYQLYCLADHRDNAINF